MQRIQQGNVTGNLKGEGIVLGGILLLDYQGQVRYAHLEETGEVLPRAEFQKALQSLLDEYQSSWPRFDNGVTTVFDTTQPNVTLVLDSPGPYSAVFPDMMETANTVVIPTSQATTTISQQLLPTVYLQFDLEEKCNWNNHPEPLATDDLFYIRIASNYLDPGIFYSHVQDYPEGQYDVGYYSTVMQGIITSSSPTVNSFTFLIPPSVYAEEATGGDQNKGDSTPAKDHKLVWGIRLMTKDSPGCLAVANVKVWMVDAEEEEEDHLSASLTENVNDPPLEDETNTVSDKKDEL
mmetsp:Transcript_4204/g.9040  ORF Transcript_4204/g.9040 Transcript_4204/m.9040 type:complete len:293 (-) Transcript_4204:483-1361(-)